MIEKREIHGLNYAVVEFVSSLIRLLPLEIRSWDFQAGLNLKISYSDQERGELIAEIHPVGKPEITIKTHFFRRKDSRWTATKGMFYRKRDRGNTQEVHFSCFFNEQWKEYKFDLIDKPMDDAEEDKN